MRTATGPRWTCYPRASAWKSSLTGGRAEKRRRWPAVTEAGISVLAGYVVYEALAPTATRDCGRGGLSVGRRRLAARRSRADGICDGLLMSVGWAPSDALLCQARGKMAYDPELEQFVPQKLPAGVLRRDG